MKKILIILLLLFPLLLSAQNVYYVSTSNSSDSYDGLSPTYVSGTNGPWATWQKAFDTADAGDTVYFRGGVYMPASKATGGTGVCVIYPGTGHGHNGTWDAPIVYMNYPGEKPILDGSLAANADYGNIGLVIQYATNLKFIGLTFRNNPMKNATDNSGGVSFAGLDDGGNVYFENCEFYYNGGPGLWCRGYDTVYVINCDSHHNLDSLDASYGGGGDGFALSSRGAAADTFKLTVVHGSRSWNNSDDGFDIGSTKQVQFYNNWVWNNGYVGGSGEDGGGDGVGLKLSYSHLAIPTKRQVYNSIFAWNRSMGGDAGAGIAEVNLYDEGDFGPLVKAYNNIMYRNYAGFGSSLSWGHANYPTNYYNDSLLNNIIFGHEYTYPAYFKAVNYSQGDPSYVTLLTNTFAFNGSVYGNCTANATYTLSSADFLALPSDSLDCIDILGAPRQADGSLPDIGNYFKLAVGSDMKAAGTDVGMTATPDLGVDWDYLETLDPGDDYPTVITLAITDYNAVSAVIGANIIADGGASITGKGVCYSTSENPTTSDNTVVFNPATGSSSLRLTTLKGNTTYYFRAYAINSVGTSYGNQVSITTDVHNTGTHNGKVLKYNGQTVIVR